MGLVWWLKRLVSRQPHYIIGEPGRPYLLRWFLIPENRFFKVYLHKFVRSDDDRALHDHPWWFASLMIRGAYLEYFPDGSCIRREAGSFAIRSADHRHRVELIDDRDGKPIPCWTLIVTGPKVRDWGFWCPQGFVPWQQFVSPADSGQIGRGCE